MRISFTGPARGLSTRQSDLITAVAVTVCGNYPQRDLVIKTGAAIGVDTAAANACLHLFPDARHELYVPGMGDLWHNDELVSTFAQRAADAHVILVPGTYMDRNHELAQTDIMLAFPGTATEAVRSGTWATVRRARRYGADVRVHPLAG